MEPMKTSLANKRAYGRVPFTGRLMVLDASSGQKFEANGINIGVAGIGFYSEKLFQKDSRISIQVCLDNASHLDPVWINATVRWSKIEQDGAVMGVQFDTFIKSVEHPELYELIYEKKV